MPIKARRVLAMSFRARNLNAGAPLSGDGRIHEIPANVQAITSDGHPFQLLGKAEGNIGGPFTSQKVEVRVGGHAEPMWIKNPAVGTNPPYKWAQEYFTLPVPSPEISLLLTRLTNAGTTTQATLTYLGQNCALGFSNSEMIAMGTEAIDRMAPLTPAVETAATMAEFFSERKFFNVPGNAGSAPGEYLNYQFGIAPTVGFAKDLRKAIQDKEKIVRQTARDSGRRVRRRGDVYSDSSGTSSSETLLGAVYPDFVGPTPVTQCVKRGQLTVTKSTSRRAWFSGAFTYYLPEEGIMRTVAELDAKYGVKPGADTAWELLPFSWLVDYKISAGSAIANFNRFASDGVVMNYGYIMGEQITREDHVWQGEIRQNGAFKPLTLSATVVKTTKQRLPASPFGFGILPGDLSTRQWSILAALGMTYLK